MPRTLCAPGVGKWAEWMVSGHGYCRYKQDGVQTRRTLQLRRLLPITMASLLSTQINKLTSVFHASVLLLIMNFVITLSKAIAEWIRRLLWQLFIIREVNSDMPIYILNRTNARKNQMPRAGFEPTTSLMMNNLFERCRVTHTLTML